MSRRSFWRGRYNVGVRLEERARAWEQERGAWLSEKERLLAEMKHYKEFASISTADVDILYADLGIAQEDSQKLAIERSGPSSPKSPSGDDSP
ncbi:hypothetical protein HanPI659440_Chr15g0609501 [Helianthus annuus]|nr:hypothetical protein HanPI659440_Chr15g0609501 [Helianthus annuus]